MSWSLLSAKLHSSVAFKFQLSATKWLISSPSNFHATFKLENTFNASQIDTLTLSMP
jgi:hypothetical protein